MMGTAQGAAMLLQHLKRQVAQVSCWLAGGRLRARGCLNNVGGVEMLVWSSSLLVVGSGV
jgi:hypothetical protein